MTEYYNTMGSVDCRQICVSMRLCLYEEVQSGPVHLKQASNSLTLNSSRLNYGNMNNPMTHGMDKDEEEMNTNANAGPIKSHNVKTEEATEAHFIITTTNTHLSYTRN